MCDCCSAVGQERSALRSRVDALTSELSLAREGAADLRLRLEAFTGPTGPQARVRQLEASLQNVRGGLRLWQHLGGGDKGCCRRRSSSLIPHPCRIENLDHVCTFWVGVSLLLTPESCSTCSEHGRTGTALQRITLQMRVLWLPCQHALP